MEEALIKRVLPHSLEAEQSVIGSMLMDREAVIAASEIITGSDFYQQQYGIMFDAMVELFNEGKPVDLVTLQDRLKEKDVPPEVSSLDFVRDIITMVPTSANVRSYAAIVGEKAVLRRLIKTTEEIANTCYAGKEPLENILADTEKSVFNLLQNRGGQDFVPIKQVAINVLEKIEDAYKNQGTVTGIPSGFIDLDYKLSGFQPSDFILIAARPSMGKTSFLLNIIEHIALNEKKPTLLFSCEMPAVQIVERLLFARSGVRSREIIKRGNLTQLEMKHFKQAVKEVGASQLVIDDTAAISINELRAKARRVMRDQGGLAAIGVDYLQLMRSHSKQAANSREREVAEISAGLKALAKELKVPVIVLAQLNRGPESRTGASLGVPRISDLRESGSIEQDADMIGLLYRSAYYAEDEEKRQQMAGRANLHLAKNRNGPTGDVPLHFEAELMRFSTREADEHDQESE